jgi:hypothetical protein
LYGLYDLTFLTFAIRVKWIVVNGRIEELRFGNEAVMAYFKALLQELMGRNYQSVIVGFTDWVRIKP